MACGFSILAITGMQYALLAHDLADVLDVGGVAHEAQRDEVDGQRQREPEVLDVLLRQCRHGHCHPGQVDALVVADLAADEHLGDDVGALEDLEDPEPHLAVVDEERVADPDVPRQALVRRPADLGVAVDVAGRDRPALARGPGAPDRRRTSRAGSSGPGGRRGCRRRDRWRPRPRAPGGRSRAWSSWVPWLMLSRATSIPASTSSRILRSRAGGRTQGADDLRSSHVANPSESWNDQTGSAAERR